MERKGKMKGMAKRVAVAVTAVAVVLGSVSAPATAEAKGTAFLKKKVSSVTPTIKSAKRSGGRIRVTVSVPAAKVRKLGKVKKITVAYGSTKNSRKFEAKKAQAKVTKKGKNQYTFTLKDNKYKNYYMAVQFSGKSNWSKMAKASGSSSSAKEEKYWLKCNGKGCDFYVEGNDMDKLIDLHYQHTTELCKKFEESMPNNFATVEERIAYIQKYHPGTLGHGGYTNGIRAKSYGYSN